MLLVSNYFLTSVVPISSPCHQSTHQWNIWESPLQKKFNLFWLSYYRFWGYCFQWQPLQSLVCGNASI